MLPSSVPLSLKRDRFGTQLVITTILVKIWLTPQAETLKNPDSRRKGVKPTSFFSAHHRFYVLLQAEDVRSDSEDDTLSSETDSIEATNEPTKNGPISKKKEWIVQNLSPRIFFAKHSTILPNFLAILLIFSINTRLFLLIFDVVQFKISSNQKYSPHGI